MDARIRLPDHLVRRLQAEAGRRHQDVPQLVAELLEAALEPAPADLPSLDDIVAAIRATPPNLAAFHPAIQPLAELLRHSPEEPDFDLEQWTAEWAKVEDEMRDMTRSNARAEGLE